jgi:hypothetical protein
MDCKTRFDLCSHHDWVYDLKTTGDASPESFSRDIARYGYHIQAYFYLKAYKAAFGKTAKGFRFIAAEKKYPYAVAVYEASPAMIQRGGDLVEDALERLAECKASDCWPSYSDEVETIELPTWAQQDKETLEIDYV